MENEIEFVGAMQCLDGTITDLAEALYYAMDVVSRYPNDNEVRYFGPIGEGVFYTGSSFEGCRWFPDTNVVEALGILSMDLGEEAVEGIDIFSTY